MTDFTASNGFKLRLSSYGGIDFDDDADGDDWLVLCGPSLATALREFFQKDEDDRLGRWRWPANPDYVVYPEGEAARVLRESAGTNWYPLYRPVAPVSAGAAIQYRIAAAYFDALRERKPWHDAKHGEIWVLFVAIEEEAYRVDGDSFVPVNNPNRIRIPITDSRISSARRIYPEVTP